MPAAGGSADPLPQADLPHSGSSQPPADVPPDDALDGAVSDPAPASNKPMDGGPSLSSSLPSPTLSPAGHPIYPNLAEVLDAGRMSLSAAPKPAQ